MAIVSTVFYGTKQMSTRHPQINIRVPEHVKSGLHHAAELSGRSVNSEIVFRLEQSFGKMPIDTLVPANEVRARALSLSINSIEERFVAEVVERINSAACLGRGEVTISIDEHQPKTNVPAINEAFVSTVQRLSDTLIKLGYEVEIREAASSLQVNKLVIRF